MACKTDNYRSPRSFEPAHIDTVLQETTKAARPLVPLSAACSRNKEIQRRGSSHGWSLWLGRRQDREFGVARLSPFRPCGPSHWKLGLGAEA